MTDPQHVAKEQEAQEARFEDFIKNPRAYANPPAPPPAPPATRRIEFIGRDGQDGTELDLRARLGPLRGYYPGGNDAEEAVPMQDLPDSFLSEEQRAAREAIPAPPPQQPAMRPQPTPLLYTYISAASLRPPPSTQPMANMPLYAIMHDPGSDIRNRPPANVQPPINMELGLVEICTFMPDWLLVPELLVRLMRNGADATMLAKIELSATNQLSSTNLNRRRHSIAERMGKHGKGRFDIPCNQVWDFAYAQNAGPENDLTVSSWTNPTGEAWGSWKLVSMYSQVPRENWPKGEDRMLFTQCMEFAAAFPAKDLDTSHIPWIVQTLRLQQPAAPVQRNRDQAAVARFSIPDPSE